MAIYRIWRQSDNETFDMEARDDEHAVKVFGELLGVTLTLAEGPAAPPYMMGLIEKDVSWTKKPNIAVYEIP